MAIRSEKLTENKRKAAVGCVSDAAGGGLNLGSRVASTTGGTNATSSEGGPLYKNGQEAREKMNDGKVRLERRLRRVL